MPIKTFPLRTRGWLGLIVLSAAASAANPTPLVKRVGALYQPLVGDGVCLSPDGRRIAYVQHEKGRVWVRVTDVDPPHLKKAWPMAEDDPTTARAGAAVPAAVTFLEWALGDRLVVQTDRAEIFAIDVATGAVRKLVDEDKVGTTFMLDAGLLMDHGGTRSADGGVVEVDARIATELSRAMDDSKFRQAGALLDEELLASLAATAAIRDAIVDYAEKTAGDGDSARQEMDRVREIPRIPRVLGLLPDREQVLIAATGSPPRVAHAVFRVHVATGQLALVEEHDISGQLLCDAQGRPVVAYAQANGGESRGLRYRLPEQKGQKKARWTSPAGEAAREFSVTGQNYHGERSMVLGLDGDPTRVLVASNVGRETFAIFTWNLATGERGGLLAEDARYDLVGLEPRFPHPTLVRDPVTRRVVGLRHEAVPSRAWWRDAQLSAMHRQLGEKFAGRSAELLGWDDARTRFLVRVSTAGDPGRIFVYQPKDQLCFELLRRAPALPRSELATTQVLANGDAKAGAAVLGTLVLPPAPRINPPPLVIFLRDDLLQRPPSGFDSELQLFAAMGFLAARVDYRGTAGRGRQHLTAIQAGFDRVPVEDALQALEAIGRQHAFDRRRVAIAGEGFGGYVALRALQLQPTIFRCAVSINAPLDLRPWTLAKASEVTSSVIVRPDITRVTALLQPPPQDFVTLPPGPVDFFAEVRRKFIAASAVPLAGLAVLREPQAITKPVFLAVNPRDSRADASDTRALRTALQRLKRPVEYLEIGDDFAAGAPDARAAVFRRIEEFFNLHVYDYKVNVGEAKEAR